MAESITTLLEGKFFNSEKRWRITAEIFLNGQMRIFNSHNNSVPGLDREAQIELLKLLLKLHPLDALGGV